MDLNRKHIDIFFSKLQINFMSNFSNIYIDKYFLEINKKDNKISKIHEILT